VGAKGGRREIRIDRVVLGRTSYESMNDALPGF
jgi:hypothetical protein